MVPGGARRPLIITGQAEHTQMGSGQGISSHLGFQTHLHSWLGGPNKRLISRGQKSRAGGVGEGKVRLTATLHMTMVMISSEGMQRN